MGNFELDLTSHLFYLFITLVSTILLFHMYGRRYILFFLPPDFRAQINEELAKSNFDFFL